MAGQVQLIIFDLDGVLCDTRPLHYHALNAALGKIGEQYVITPSEHEAKYDGLPTSAKLKLLQEEKGLPAAASQEIWAEKQEATIKLLAEQLTPRPELTDLLNTLRAQGYKLYLASNSVRITVDAALKALGVADLFDRTFSNNDVKLHKPHPEIYLRCVLEAGLSPKEVMICEDSPIGRRAALESGCHLCPIENCETLTLAHVQRYLEFYDRVGQVHEHQLPWIDPTMNVVIPMAGAGSRFQKAGYDMIKPLIDVRGRPMIQRVVENLNIMGKHIFVCQQSHIDQFHLRKVLPWVLSPFQPCIVRPVSGLSEGAACTILTVADVIDSDAPLLIANSDQYVEGSLTAFLYKMQSSQVDGGMLVFHAENDPKWSYAKTDEDGWVTELKEKDPISNWATVGIYYWKRGSDFVRHARNMIAKNIRVNNEFYVAPVFNEAIAEGAKIAIFPCERMWGLGTPDDLNHFLNHHKGHM